MGKTIKIDRSPDFHKRSFTLNKHYNTCPHNSVDLCEERRMVHCIDCDSWFEPFEFMYMVAINETIAYKEYIALTKEVNRLEAKKNQLKLELKTKR